jgi:hypothetical protein
MKNLRNAFIFIFIYLSVSFSFSSLYGQCANITNIYSFTYNGKNYEVIKELKSWVAACSCAVQRGGYLAEINNQNEQNAIYNAIIGGAGVSPTYTAVSDGGGTAYVWIGATDRFAEGTWKWDGNNDGTGINFWNGQGNAGTGGGAAVSGSYVHWGGTTSGPADEPDNFNNNQNAAGMALAAWPYGIAGEWNDIGLFNTLYYVVEYNATGINENNVNPGFNIFPDHEKNTLVIESNSKEKIISSITLYNLLGSVVFKKDNLQTSNTIIDLNELSSNVYIINIESGKGNFIRKKIFID